MQLGSTLVQENVKIIVCNIVKRQLKVKNDSLNCHSPAQLCNLNGGNGDEDTQCVEEFTASLTRYRWFFNLGQFLNGIGAAPLITLGTTLLDESVSKKNSPMYIGIFQVI